MRRGGAAATADEVEPSRPGPLCQLGRESFGRFRKTGGKHGIGQAGIWVRADQNGSQPRQFLDKRTHLPGAERAIDADAQQWEVGDRVPPRRRYSRPGSNAGLRIGTRSCHAGTGQNRNRSHYQILLAARPHHLAGWDVRQRDSVACSSGDYRCAARRGIFSVGDRVGVSLGAGRSYHAALKERRDARKFVDGNS